MTPPHVRPTKMALSFLASTLPSKLHIRLRFYRVFKRFPELTVPQTFNEKIQKRKLCWKNPLFVQCADKYEVRRYVEEIVGANYLIPLLYVGDTVDVETVRTICRTHGSVVLKANNISGLVHFLDEDSSESAIRSAIRKSSWKSRVIYGVRKDEGWYRRIVPKLLIEKFIKHQDGGVPEDYKFHVFNSWNERRVVLQVDFGRFGSHTRAFFDEDFNCLPMKKGGVPKDCRQLTRPRGYDEMFWVAKTLAKDFSYVRIDLFNAGRVIKFNEMTFAPGSGFSPFSRLQDDLWMGSLWQGDIRY